jgi:hypothetical protein
MNSARDFQTSTRFLRITRRGAAGIAVMLAALAAIVLGADMMLKAPIALAFEPPVGAAQSADDAAPQRARYDSASDKFQLLGRCFDAQAEPLVIGGEILVLRVSARDGLPYASRFRPPRWFIASVSRAAAPVLLDAAHFLSGGSGKAERAETSLTVAMPIERIEDEVRIFIVATRDPSVDATTMEEGLRNHLRGLSGAGLFETATNFLSDRLGTEISYQFKVTNDPNACLS